MGAGGIAIIQVVQVMGAWPIATLVEGERGDFDQILDIWNKFWRDAYSSSVEGRCLHARPRTTVNFASFFSILVDLQRRGHHPHLLDKEIAAQRDSDTCLQARVRNLATGLTLSPVLLQL